MKNIFAIIGPTASGKSNLAIKLAKELDAIILSADSLSIYKEIDIASAKPTKDEQDGILHFGIDIVQPNENFDVIKFISEYNRALNYAQEYNKKLIIAGGTSFYIKALTQGISHLPVATIDQKKLLKEILEDKDKAYRYLQQIDLEYSKRIKPNDIYRLEKALNIYIITREIPSKYFRNNLPVPIAKDLDIYEIAVDRETLRDRVKLRTKKMISMGLIDEVSYLEHKYTRAIQAMGAIGVVEVLDYFDGKLNISELESKIITNTMRLAKRQVTFNKSQLNIEYKDSIESIYRSII